MEKIYRSTRLKFAKKLSTIAMNGRRECSFIFGISIFLLVMQ
jgi:hypothetical protein